MELRGKVALVTGGNGGIGLGMARGLAACGARVLVAGRDTAKNSAAVAELGRNAAAFAVDLLDPAAAPKLVADVLAVIKAVEGEEHRLNLTLATDQHTELG